MPVQPSIRPGLRLRPVGRGGSGSEAEQCERGGAGETADHGCLLGSIPPLRGRPCRRSRVDLRGGRGRIPAHGPPRRRPLCIVSAGWVPAGRNAPVRGAQAGDVRASRLSFGTTGPLCTGPPTSSSMTPAPPRTSPRRRFLAAVRNLDRFDRRRPFGPWLHRIVVNRAIDWRDARRCGRRRAATRSPRWPRLTRTSPTRPCSGRSARSRPSTAP